MNALDIKTYEEGNTCHIIITNVNTDIEKERIQDLVSAFIGVENQFSEYFNEMYDDEEEEQENQIGTLNVVPEGEYRGFTIQDVYNIYGHESLVNLLLQIKKMKTVPQNKQDDLYKEAILFAISAIRQKQVDLAGFVEAYHPFLTRKMEGIEGTPEDWLNLPDEEKNVFYDKLIKVFIERMKKSL